MSMVKAITAGLVAVFAVVGCAGDDASLGDTEVLGVVATEGGTPHARTGAPSGTTPATGGGESLTRSEAPSEPVDPTETGPRHLRVGDATVTDQLHWGRAANGDCTQILDPAVIERDDYVLSAGVRPFVERDCPDWDDRYDLTCVIVLQSAADHSTLMQGEANFELFVDDVLAGSWSLEVAELAAPGERVEIGSADTAEVSSDGLPDVRCDATFTAS